MERIKKHIRTLEMYKLFQLLNHRKWTDKTEPYDPAYDLLPLYRTAAHLKEDFPGDTAGVLELFCEYGILWIGEPECHSNGKEYIPIRVLAPIQANIARLPAKPLPKDLTALWMAESLRYATLPSDLAEVPEYWRFFDAIRWGDRMGYFLHCDLFGRRWHSPVTNMKKELRKKLLLYGQPVIQADLDQCQPRLLAAILEKELGPNSFSRFLRDGGDIY